MDQPGHSNQCRLPAISDWPPPRPNAREAGFPLSLHEEGALRRIALSISKPKHLPARDVDYLIRLGLVEEIRDR